jgi:hypothetical protein
MVTEKSKGDEAGMQSTEGSGVERGREETGSEGGQSGERREGCTQRRTKDTRSVIWVNQTMIRDVLRAGLPGPSDRLDGEYGGSGKRE